MGGLPVMIHRRGNAEKKKKKKKTAPAQPRFGEFRGKVFRTLVAGETHSRDANATQTFRTVIC
jgi:hypothetical protein